MLPTPWQGGRLSLLPRGSAAPEGAAGMLLPALWQRPWAQPPSQRIRCTQGRGPGCCYTPSGRGH